MGYSAAAMVASAYMQSRNKPQMPQAPAVTPPPQAAQAPNVQGVAAGQAGAGQAGGKAGYAQTFLAGPAGVDPNSLKLGKPTLLGG